MQRELEQGPYKRNDARSLRSTNRTSEDLFASEQLGKSLTILRSRVTAWLGIESVKAATGNEAKI